jgi:hypothetical protein
LMLARPNDRRIKQSGDADPVRESPLDGSFNSARGKRAKSSC